MAITVGGLTLQTDVRPAWCVATDVDLMETYVGGAEECVAALLADGHLEVMPVTAGHALLLDDAPVNPPPGG